MSHEIQPINKSVFTFRLAAVGLVGCLLHLANLAYVFRYGSTTGTDYTQGADTPVYRGMADAWERGARVDPMYQERVLVPLILRGLRTLGLADRTFPWVVALFIVPAVVALGWFAYFVSGRRWVAYISGVLMGLYPTAYQYGVLVETDTLHLYLATIAVCATVMGKKLAARSWYGAAAVAWPLAHLTRPALWGMGLFLPLYLLSELRMRSVRKWAWLLCAGAWVVPVGFGIFNLARFGIAAPSLHTAEIMFVWTRSRVYAAVESERRGGEWTPLVRDAVAAARQDARWAVLHGNYSQPEELAAAYRSVLAETKRFLANHRNAFLKTTLGEFLHQCAAPLRFYNRYNVPPLESLYPNMERAARIVLKLGWWFGLCGWAWLFGGKNRDVAMLLLAVAAVNFLPSSLSCWAGARMRMVTDALGIPLIVASISQLISWAGLIALVLLAYLPRRMGAPAGYFNAAALVVAATWTAWIGVRTARSERRDSGAAGS